MKFRCQYFRCIRMMFVMSVVGLTIVTVSQLYKPKNAPLKTAGGYTQADVDELARTLKIHAEVEATGHLYKIGLASRVKISLSNKGTIKFPARNWRIFFTQVLGVEVDSTKRGEIAVKVESSISIKHWNGQLYSLQPEPDFGFLMPGESRLLYYNFLCCSMVFSDIYPNWYLELEGLEARLIESTAGEPDKFVTPHNFPKAWHGVREEDQYMEDIFNPPVHQTVVKNLGHPPIPVIPTPFYIESPKVPSKVNVFNSDWVIVSHKLFGTAIAALSDHWNIGEVTSKPESHYVHFLEADVRIMGKNKILSAEEAYVLIVEPYTNVILIKAKAPAGAFYAVQSLLALLDKDGNIPGITITDGPRYRYRGVMIDVARNFHSKESILRYIEVMAMYKLNKLHLHLTDDEGWRLEIPGLPELTEVGARRCHDLIETRCILPFLGSGPEDKAPGSGFYSVEDYRDILRYAQAHHIEVIPEIDVPGHSHAAIKAMQVRLDRSLQRGISDPDKYMLSDLKDNSRYYSVQMFKDGVINPCLMSTYNFISRVMQELQRMHKDISPLRLFHFGGDEVPEKAWARSAACLSLGIKQMRRQLKQIFVTKVANLADQLGLDLAGWEDGIMVDRKPIARSKFQQKNVYAYIWNNVGQHGNSKHAYTLANAGYKVVLTPATNLYFDHPHDADPQDRGLIWATRHVDTKQVFQLMPENIYASSGAIVNGKPIPTCTDTATLCPPLERPQNIEGIQGTLFGELLRSEEIVDYMLLPRMLALAERAWHEAPWELDTDENSRKIFLDEDYEKFANTLGHRELARLDVKGFKYRIPTPIAEIKDGILYTSLQFPGLVIEMSEDGGKSWQEVISGKTKIVTTFKLFLRTKAAFGKRYSRTVSLTTQGKL